MMMIDRDEYRGWAFPGHDAGQIVIPHKIDPPGCDRAVVGARAVWASARWWARRPCSRISRKARRRLVRMPAKRSRAHSLR